MRNILTVVKDCFSNKRMEGIKERVFKNHEVVLDALGSTIEGGKQCEGLMGGKCIGKACQKFMEWHVPQGKDKPDIVYWRCAYVQTPILLTEVNVNLQRMITLQQKQIESLNKA